MLGDELDALWDFSRPEASEHRIRARLERESDLNARAIIQTQVARALGLQRRFDAARECLDLAEPDATAALARAYLSIERGRVFDSSGNPGRAAGCFQAALEFALEAGDEALAIDAMHMLAIARPDEAPAWNRRALALAEQSMHARSRRWRASLHNNLGWNLFEQAEHAVALEHFERALALRRELGHAQEERIARWCVARCLRALGQLRRALEVQQDLLTEFERLGEPDGYVFEELGECLLALGRPEEARVHFARAVSILEQDAWFVRHEGSRLQRLRDLAAA